MYTYPAFRLERERDERILARLKLAEELVDEASDLFQTSLDLGNNYDGETDLKRVKAWLKKSRSD